MRHIGRQSAILAILTVLTVGIVCAFGPGRALAQNVPSANPGSNSGGASGSSTKGLKRVIAGMKAYKAGKMDSTISALTAAMSSGGLSSKDLAKALYYRGLAYRRKQQPAEAIADLTSSIWLKGGLTDTERADALKNRASAYQEAGIKDPGIISTASKGPPAAKAQAAAPAAAPGAWQTATQTQTATKTAATTATPPSSAPSANPTAVSTTNPSPPTTLSVAPTASTTPTTTAPSIGNPLKSVGTFFSGLFSGTSSPSKKSASDNAFTTTGTVTPTNAPQKSATSSPSLATPATGQVSAVSGWSSKTQVETKAASNIKIAARPAQQPSAKPKAIAGRYSVRIAAVRSQDEATKVVSLFESNHAAALAGRKPQIATESFGNMGTFYNVQVGPFARAQDYKALCAAARKNGYDCLVLKK